MISRSSVAGKKTELVPSLCGKGKGTGLLSACRILFKIFSFAADTAMLIYIDGGFINSSGISVFGASFISPTGSISSDFFSS